MENPSPQPNYFRFSETPPEQPKSWFQRPQMVRRMGVAILTLAIVGIGGVLVRNLVKSRTPNTLTPLEAAQQETAHRQTQCDDTDEACKNTAQADVAREAGVASACEGLDDDAKENCVILIAHDTRKGEVCNVLEGTARTRCADAVIVATAYEAKNVSFCEGVTKASMRASCLAIIEARAVAESACAEYGVEVSACDSAQRIKDLLSAGNFAGCAELSERERDTCIDIFVSTDADSDGLDAKQESELGTSDANPDTDGDGYPDGTEVAAGYNPLK